MISRRSFAKVVGGAALAPGFLFHARVAAAAPAGPVRFLAVRTPHGVDRDFWIPRTASGAEPGAADVPLGELTFEYDGGILAPLQKWRERITVLDGLDTQVTKEATRAGRRNAHGHNEQGALLTGAQPPADREGNYDNHPSLDFYLHGRLTSPALITACVEGTGSWKCISYDQTGKPRAPEANPKTVFRAAFPADFKPGAATGPSVDTAKAEQRIAAYADAALKRMRERLSAAERGKLDAHIEALLRQTPGMTPAAAMGKACTTSGTDVPLADGQIKGPNDVETVTRAHAKVITQAFACGRARVATLQILNDYPNYFSDLPDVRTPFVIGKYGSTFRFHENLVHDYWGASGNDRKELGRGYCAGLRWSAGHFAAVLQELDAVVDPLDPNGGTLLDNTVVFWHNEFGHDGHDNQHTRHPAVIAGGGGRTLKLGRYLRLRTIQSNDRVPHNRLLTSLCIAMGLKDVEYFGDRDLVNRAEYRGPLLPLMV